MPIPYTSHLRSDGELLAQAAARDLDAHVPTCPDWNVAKLVIHTGGHHRWVADAVRGGGKPPPEPKKPGLRGDELLEWFRAGWRELADLLDASDDATTAWSWSGDNRVGFWRRRTACETLVHRWDAENAFGEPSPLDAELARDGVDEMFTVFAREPEGAYEGPDARVGLKTDGATWILGLEHGKTPAFAPATGDAEATDVRIEARAEDLLLFLWGRLGRDVLTVSGDGDLAASILDWLED